MPGVGPDPARAVSFVGVPARPRHCTEPFSNERSRSPAAKVSDGGGGDVLETVTVTGSETVTLPAASRATAGRGCGPSGAVGGSPGTGDGAPASSSPKAAPSRL